MNHLAALTPARWLVIAAVGALIGLWIASGSLVFALLVLVLVGGVAGLAALGLGTLRPRPDPSEVPLELPTVTVDAPGRIAGVRRALRGALARPWVRGDGLVRATAARLRTDEALVVTARGERAAAPHVWLEWSVADALEVSGRRPLDALVTELADEYVEHVRATGRSGSTAAPRLHLLARGDVPVGRVVVTAAYAPPADEAVAVSGGSHASGGSPASGPGRRPGPSPTRRAVGGHPGRPGSGPVAVLAATSPGGADVVLRGPAGPGGTALCLGRDPRGDVVVDHPSVSWRHLVLRSRDGRTWMVEDLASSNGTAVAGRRITGPTPLRPGDTVAVGTDGPRYRFRAAGDGAVPIPGPERRAHPKPTPQERTVGWRREVV